jgi:HTH-type transcriptional regulator / antitoxin HipB
MRTSAYNPRMQPNVDISGMYAYVGIMHAATASQLGALIRRERRARHLTQTALAENVGVTRAWLSACEAGKPTAELGLVLRTLAALDLVVDVVPAGRRHGLVDLDELFGGTDDS